MKSNVFADWKITACIPNEMQPFLIKLGLFAISSLSRRYKLQSRITQYKRQSYLLCRQVWTKTGSGIRETLCFIPNQSQTGSSFRLLFTVCLTCTNYAAMDVGERKLRDSQIQSLTHTQKSIVRLYGRKCDYLYLSDYIKGAMFLNFISKIGYRISMKWSGSTESTKNSHI